MEVPITRDQRLAEYRLRYDERPRRIRRGSLVQELERLRPDWQVMATIAEKTLPDQLLAGGVLVLASGTWKSAGSDGQLNANMSALLLERGNNLDLGGRPCACIGLGDDRYFYTARAVDLLESYVTTHQGRLLFPSLKIVNEPYGQEQKVRLGRRVGSRRGADWPVLNDGSRIAQNHWRFRAGH